MTTQRLYPRFAEPRLKEALADTPVNLIPMRGAVGQIEKRTQRRVVRLFREQLCFDQHRRRRRS